MKYLVLLLALVFINCAPIENNEFTIKGNSQQPTGSTVYVHKYDHFNYLDADHILDSATVAKDGNFELNFKYKQDKLVYISKFSTPPPSYLVFRSNPEHYYYSFCANFFAMSPTIYLGNGSYYQIHHWDGENDDNSIDFENENLNLLRQYYRHVDYRGELADANRTPLKIDPGVAWRMIERKRDQLLEEFEVENEYPLSSYESYLKTEICLGAINDFLVWYNLREEGGAAPELIENILKQYNNGEWNANSVEYFKLTERYVTHQINLQKGMSGNYYPADETKLYVAMEHSRHNIRSQYVSNMKKLVPEKLGKKLP